MYYRKMTGIFRLFFFIPEADWNTVEGWHGGQKEAIRHDAQNHCATCQWKGTDKATQHDGRNRRTATQGLINLSHNSQNIGSFRRSSSQPPYSYPNYVSVGLSSVESFLNVWFCFFILSKKNSVYFSSWILAIYYTFQTTLALSSLKA